jgi:hypothetical protein
MSIQWKQEGDEERQGGRQKAADPVAAGQHEGEIGSTESRRGKQNVAGGHPTGFGGTTGPSPADRGRHQERGHQEGEKAKHAEPLLPAFSIGGGEHCQRAKEEEHGQTAEQKPLLRGHRTEAQCQELSAGGECSTNPRAGLIPG